MFDFGVGEVENGCDVSEGKIFARCGERLGSAIAEQKRSSSELISL